MAAILTVRAGGQWRLYDLSAERCLEEACAVLAELRLQLGPVELAILDGWVLDRMLTAEELARAVLA